MKPTYTVVTKIFAVIVAALAAYFVTPAGAALIASNPKIAAIAAAIIAVAALVNPPKSTPG